MFIIDPDIRQQKKQNCFSIYHTSFKKLSRIKRVKPLKLNAVLPEISDIAIAYHTPVIRWNKYSRFMINNKATLLQAKFHILAF